MAEIINFPPGDGSDLFWRCASGRISFRLKGDGLAECCQCGDVVRGPGGTWRQDLPAPPVTAPAAGSDTLVRVTSLLSSAAALRRTLGRATTHRTAVVVVMQNDGGVSTWGDLATNEEADWFDRRVATAKQMLTGR